MSLLNLTSDGLPNILVVLYAAIAKARAPMTAKELIEAIAPESVVKDARIARTTLNRWTELGLFKEDPDTKGLSLHRPPPSPHPRLRRQPARPRRPHPPRSGGVVGDADEPESPLARAP